MGLLDSLKKMFSGNARYYHEALGLSAEEDFKTISVCALWQEPTKREEAGAAALAVVGLFTGHTVDMVGVQATAGVTTTGRLVVGMIEGHDQPLSFDAGSGHELVDTGRTSKDKVMGPTGQMEQGKMLSLRSPDGELFQIIIGASKASEFAGWK